MNAILLSNVLLQEVKNMEETVTSVVDTKDLKIGNAFQIVTLKLRNSIQLLINAHASLDVLELAQMSPADLLVASMKYGMEDAFVSQDLEDFQEIAVPVHNTQLVTQPSNVFVIMVTIGIREN